LLADEAFLGAVLAGRFPAGVTREAIPVAASGSAPERSRGWAAIWDRVMARGPWDHPLFYEPDMARARRGKQSLDPRDRETYEGPEGLPRIPVEAAKPEAAAATGLFGM